MQGINEIKNTILMHDNFPSHSLKAKAELFLFDGAATKTKINAAALLGKEVNKPIYGITAISLLSNYIGKTEKT